MGSAVHPALHEHGVSDGFRLRLVTAGCLLIFLAFTLTGCNGNSSLKSGNSETIVDGNTPPILALLAGSITGAGNFNGQGSEARFNSPQSIAVDLNGNIYIADTRNNQIRKISPYEDVTTFAGSGAYGRSNGQGIAASFNSPEAIAVDNKGNVYVADTYNNVIRKIDTEGNVTTLAGSGIPGSFNGRGLTSSFNHPAGIAVDINNNVYVADTGNNLIRKIDTEGNVTTVAGSGESGFANGPSAAASFDYPHNIAIDANDNVYVADANNSLIRKIDSRGNVTTLAGGTFGNTNGPALSASFSNTYGVAVDISGNVYVADTTNNLIRKIDTEGNVTTLAGDGSAGNIDGQGIAADLAPFSRTLC